MRDNLNSPPACDKTKPLTGPCTQTEEQFLRQIRGQLKSALENDDLAKVSLAARMVKRRLEFIGEKP